MKNTILIGVILIFNFATCQKPQPETILKEFVINLFNDGVNPLYIVDKYLEIKVDSENSLSISDRKKMAVGIIDKARNGESKELGWIIPDYEIKNIKRHNIYPLKKYKKLDKLGVSSYIKYKKNTYILLDAKKEKILQYFLLNETNDKIISFSLFIKSDQAWFFTF